VVFKRKGVLGFADGRHFGRVHAWESAEACPPLKALGIDGLSREFTAKELRAPLSRSKRPVKEFLLDQTKIAGIGNIYSCEALWRARVDPRRRANSLKSREVERLHKAIVSVLRRALECCLEPAPDFRDETWWFQGLERILGAYQREGMECKRCGKTIRRIEQGGAEGRHTAAYTARNRRRLRNRRGFTCSEKNRSNEKAGF
jgi:formamidopyrimidine-DNA glycosylase